MFPSKVHEALKPIEWLIGTWEAVTAQGSFPTITDFTFNEIIKYESIGQPMLNYESNSQHPVNKNPMHLERGFLKIKPGTNSLAAMTAHNFGLTVVEEGSVVGKEIKLKSNSIGRMSFCKDPAVTEIQKTIRLNEAGLLEIITDMATSTTPLTNHLIVKYKKTE